MVQIRTIQHRLLFLLLPLVIIAFLVLAGCSYYLAKDALVKSVNQTAKAVGEDYGKRVQADMEVMLVQLADLASIQRIRTGADKKQIGEAIVEAHKRIGVFDAIVFIDKNGNGISSTGATAAYADREYFKNVMSTQKQAVSDPLVSKSTGKLAVVLAVPVKNGNDMNGVLVGTFSLERLSDMIKDLTFLETGYGQVAEASGNIIAHPKRPELTGKLNLRTTKVDPSLNITNNELDKDLVKFFTEAADTGKAISGSYTIDGVRRMASFAPVELPGGKRWVITVAAPETEAFKEINALTYLMIGISLIGLVILAVAIVVIAKKIAQPIALLRDECMLLADGNLQNRALSVDSQDEIGQLAQGFADMRGNLQQLVKTVQSQSEHVAAASEELTASANEAAQAGRMVAASITEVAGSADTQKSVAHETSTVVEQIAERMQAISTTSHVAAGDAGKAADKAQVGTAAIDKAVQQMRQIESTVDSSAQVVKELGARSQAIGQIVETISGIAGQTNLLALNAAIEAARAGEQGRGFAVVAEEVRKLAEQSQEATKQISALIAEIQTETNRAVAAMDGGTREVKVGADLVQVAGGSFQEIVGLVQTVSQQVTQISDTISHIAGDSQSIVRAASKMDSLSGKTAEEAQTVSAATEEQLAAMEEISSSSHSLAEAATGLREAIGKFVV